MVDKIGGYTNNRSPQTKVTEKDYKTPSNSKERIIRVLKDRRSELESSKSKSTNIKIRKEHSRKVREELVLINKKLTKIYDDQWKWDEK